MRLCALRLCAFPVCFPAVGESLGRHGGRRTRILEYRGEYVIVNVNGLGGARISSLALFPLSVAAAHNCLGGAQFVRLQAGARETCVYLASALLRVLSSPTVAVFCCPLPLAQPGVVPTVPPRLLPHPVVVAVGPLPRWVRGLGPGRGRTRVGRGHPVAEPAWGPRACWRRGLACPPALAPTVTMRSGRGGLLGRGGREGGGKLLRLVRIVK